MRWNEREKARRELHAGNAESALAYNARVQRLARDLDLCGGCIGGGTGTHCCMCGKPRVAQ